MNCQDLLMLSGTQPEINTIFLKVRSTFFQKLRPFGTVNITDRFSKFCVNPWLSLAQYLYTAQTDSKPETTSIGVLWTTFLLQGAASFGYCYYSSCSLVLGQVHLSRESADSLFWSTKGHNSKIQGKIKDAINVADFKAVENTLGLQRSLGNVFSFWTNIRVIIPRIYFLVHLHPVGGDFAFLMLRNILQLTVQKLFPQEQAGLSPYPLRNTQTSPGSTGCALQTCH